VVAEHEINRPLDGGLELPQVRFERRGRADVAADKDDIRRAVGDAPAGVGDGGGRLDELEMEIGQPRDASHGAALYLSSFV